MSFWWLFSVSDIIVLAVYIDKRFVILVDKLHAMAVTLNVFNRIVVVHDLASEVGRGDVSTDVYRCIYFLFQNGRASVHTQDRCRTKLSSRW